MKYQKKPIVTVDAFRIVSVSSSRGADGSCGLGLDNNTRVVASQAQYADRQPARGDFWVTEADGTSKVVAKEEFESGYIAAMNVK